MTAAEWLQLLVAPILVVGASWVAIRISVERVQGSLDKWAKLFEERGEIRDRRLLALEQRTEIAGIGEGGWFMPRRECALLERAVTQKVAALETAVKELHTVLTTIDSRLDRIERNGRKPKQGG